MNRQKEIRKKWKLEANKRFKRALLSSPIDHQFYYRRQNIQRVLACQYKQFKEYKNVNNNKRKRS